MKKLNSILLIIFNLGVLSFSHIYAMENQIPIEIKEETEIKELHNQKPTHLQQQLFNILNEMFEHINNVNGSRRIRNENILAICKCFKKIQFLVEEGKVNLNFFAQFNNSLYYKTPLMLAEDYGSIPLIRYFLAHGANPYIQNIFVKKFQYFVANEDNPRVPMDRWIDNPYIPNILKKSPSDNKEIKKIIDQQSESQLDLNKISEEILETTQLPLELIQLIINYNRLPVSISFPDLMQLIYDPREVHSPYISGKMMDFGLITPFCNGFGSSINYDEFIESRPCPNCKFICLIKERNKESNIKVYCIDKTNCGYQE